MYILFYTIQKPESFSLYICSDFPSLIWPPLSFLILSLLPFTHPSSPHPTFFPLPTFSYPSPLIQDVLGTYALLATKQWSLSPSSLPFLSHNIHHLLIHCLSACLLACQFLCSSYFCVTACSLQENRKELQNQSRKRSVGGQQGGWYLLQTIGRNEQRKKPILSLPRSLFMSLMCDLMNSIHIINCWIMADKYISHKP